MKGRRDENETTGPRRVLAKRSLPFPGFETDDSKTVTPQQRPYLRRGSEPLDVPSNKKRYAYARVDGFFRSAGGRERTTSRRRVSRGRADVPGELARPRFTPRHDTLFATVLISDGDETSGRRRGRRAGRGRSRKKGDHINCIVLTTTGDLLSGDARAMFRWNLYYSVIISVFRVSRPAEKSERETDGRKKRKTREKKIIETKFALAVPRKRNY